MARFAQPCLPGYREAALVSTFNREADGAFRQVALYTELATGARADGWSNAKVTAAGSAGKVHGPWGKECKSLSKTISIASNLSSHSCTVAWRGWGTGSLYIPFGLCSTVLYSYI